MNSVPTLSVMIVDDEAPARTRLRDLLADVAAEVPNAVVAEAANGLLAVEATGGCSVDVALVDIRMPKMDGIELARHLTRLEHPPAIIFVTAYDSYAVQAFELNAIDYLVKPVRAQRLVDALQKVRQNRTVAPQVLSQIQQGARTHLSCHERGRLLLIPLPEILYFKADLKYVTARTASREYLLDESLTHLEEEFSARFIRLHRSALVARDAIAGFEKNATEDAETQWQALLRGVPDRLPVSRRQWPLVKSYAKQLSSGV
ncbi:Positive alginate biosynthesis regulatory protein [Candidatus Propionivibrio aalborgensis]|uniref:Positive alginate biosynthesis regulatory protein n=1 Tax=Candidatus Propionivibrio aalborgensis TaxID=1860101 RepID=A0A1A8XPG3_9RHOO|nr:response regulator transcription factor [Candidatus Propionivibrio aalborgensis]MBK7566044.1 response regulator transcription factor [Propionivibrio sp.]MBK9029512.1 response regulator transcription factor [Propionivibrio sp.]SBT06322.1 Positive alginate biosynthesis regulatory protein [Candidatus Propionivibrio aalborgensis]